MPEPVTVLAADIGATSMRAGLVDDAGKILARRRTATLPERGLPDAVERLADLLEELRDGAASAPGAVGISTAGPVDPATGIYRHPPNLPGWDGLTMQPILAGLLGLPVVVGHDATLAAIAECQFGHRRGARDLIYLTVSTGIGAGIVAGGRPVTGSSGGAGEAGHLIVNPGGARCAAGCPGCLEGAASGSAIARAARDAGLPCADAAEVFAAADREPEAERIVLDAMGHLASGVAGLLAVFDPEALILGGGVTEGLRPRWDALVTMMRERALPRYADGLPVEITTLGDDASLLGAAAIALKLY
jgi:glucokinase